MDFSTDITIGGVRVTLADAERDFGTEAYMKANSIFCPMGPAHSEAWLLLTGKQLRSLDKNASHDIIWKYVTRSTTTTSTFTGWKFVKGERLLHGGNENDNSLYLCLFADARYFASVNSDSGTVLANIRSQAQYNDYYTETAGETWTTVLTDLWNGCGLLGAFPGLPGDLPIDSIPETTFIVGLNAYRSLNAVLNQLDCGICHDPTTGTYTIQQMGSAQELPANTPRLVWNSEPILGNSNVAAYVRIYFAKHHKNYGQENDTEIDNNWVFGAANSSLLVATGVSGGTGTRPLWDDMPWVLGEDGTNINTAGLTARATNRKNRYVTRSMVDPQHKIFSGILTDYLPGGQVKAVLWRNYGDANNDFGLTKTEYVAGPDLVNGYKGGHAKGIGLYEAKELSPPEYEQYSNQDISRRTYPNYPRLPNIIQVCHCDGSVRGQTVSANINGLHRARVKRIVNGTMETLETCWLLFVDDYDNLLGQVNATQGQYYGDARLTGIMTSLGETLPLYLVRNYESGVNNSGSNATTTTTTTTTLPPCSGRCKWIWNLADEIWELDSENCGAAATTTTTTTTTTVGPTTTTVPLDCECVSGTTTTTNTSTSTTTTTTTPSPCACSYPAYCGTDDGECTYTNCVSGYITSTLECTTTTSCDCSTTTTTSNCNDCADYICTPTGWLLVDNNCTGNCLAQEPDSPCNFGSTSECSGSGGTVGPGYACSGDCIYIYYNALADWYLAYANCANTTDASCYCQKPSYTGEDCARATTLCQSSHEIDPCQRCYTTTSTTTTTPITGCPGDCKFDWNQGSSTWDLISTTCTAGCSCLAPPVNGTADCEVIWTKCVSVFTTTTTTTTTTTISCNCAGGGNTCTYTFNFGTRVFELTSDTCPGMCDCPTVAEQCLPCMDDVAAGSYFINTPCGKFNAQAFIDGTTPNYGGHCSTAACASGNCDDFFGAGEPAWPTTFSQYFYQCGGGDCFGGPTTTTTTTTTTTPIPGACCDPVTHICFESGIYPQAECEGLGNVFYPGQTCAEITC